MTAVSLAIIGKNSEPLYLKEFFDENAPSSASEEELFGLPPRENTASNDANKTAGCSLRQQFLLHAALDRFEQLAGPPPGCAWRTQGVSGTDAMWAGLLCPVEDMRLYGYMTTTQIKFLICVYDDAATGDQKTEDESIKRLLINIHNLYVEYILNAFNDINGPIISSRFDSQVKKCVAAHNDSFL